MKFLPSGLNQMKSQILMPASNIFGSFPLLQKLVLSTLFCIIQISLSLAGKVWPNILRRERHIQGSDISEIAKVFPQYIQFYMFKSHSDPSLRCLLKLTLHSAAWKQLSPGLNLLKFLLQLH